MCCVVVRFSYVSAILAELPLAPFSWKNQMPDVKLPTEPALFARPARSLGLKEKAPPKPARALRAIPPALVVSGAASKVPPPPRPPMRAQHLEGIPKSSRAQSSRGPNSRATGSRPPPSRPHMRPNGSRSESSQPESLRRLVATPPMQAPSARSDDRETAHPVAATLRPAPPRRASSLVVGLGLAGMLLGSWWLLRAPAQSLQSSVHPTTARSDATTTLAPAPEATPTPTKARTTQPLDREEGTASAALPDARSAKLSGAPSLQGHAVVSGTVQPAQRPPSAGGSGMQPALEAPEPPSPAAPETASDAVANSTPPLTPLPALPAFDAGAAKRALGTSALVASSCRKGDDPRGTAEVIVTFAPSGRVTSANVNAAPFGGTATGGCIAATLRGAVVPPFGGDHVTVRKLVTIR